MTTEKLKDAEASFDSGELEELTAHVRSVLDIRDRKYGIPPKTYPKCFVGSEAVEKLVEEGIAGDATDAVRIGNMMLNAGVFHHVLDAHPFENKNLFYRFTTDEDHGMAARRPDGSAVSWADFIAPLAAVGRPDLHAPARHPGARSGIGFLFTGRPRGVRHLTAR